MASPGASFKATPGLSLVLELGLDFWLFQVGFGLGLDLGLCLGLGLGLG